MLISTIVGGKFSNTVLAAVAAVPTAAVAAVAAVVATPARASHSPP